MPPVSVISMSLLVSVAVQIACQIFKVVFYSIKDRRMQLSFFLSAGGMPSAHSAFVAALTASIGLRSGIGSDAFAVAFVFSAIVIFDSFRLRGAVENHARIIKRLAARSPDEASDPVTEMVGHTPAEIAVGVLCGGAAACAAFLLFP
jgi:uncharacterized protein